jgi:hypothetical protein
MGIREIAELPSESPRVDEPRAAAELSTRAA